MRFDRVRSVASDGHDAAPALSRRIFLKAGIASGGGLLLGFGLPALLDAGMAAASSNFALNAFIRIGRDGSVTLIMPYVEMGQGTYTSMPMLIAEELEVSLDRVTLEAAPPTIGNMQTQYSGSRLQAGQRRSEQPGYRCVM